MRRIRCELRHRPSCPRKPDYASEWLEFERPRRVQRRRTRRAGYEFAVAVALVVVAGMLVWWLRNPAVGLHYLMMGAMLGGARK
jgi:ferric-dicitrate binding protein FerR (iron transport regulator)